jgi:NAD(P)-dependent dehydrogenase (short-subunit alcohol dehydrogenase family)
VTPADPLFDIRDRVIIVTGAAGQLGRQFTQALAARGARVAALDLDAAAVEAQTASIPNASERVLPIAADVTSRPSLEAALDSIEACWGTPFGLINNAGIDASPGAAAAENGPFETYPETALDRVLDVNLKGVVLACQVFGGALAAAGRGSVVNIGSIYGLVSPDQRIYEYRRQGDDTFFKPVAYAASKSGVLNLTRYLATYWARRNVRVNTLTFAGVFNDQDERFLEGYIPRVPLGRMARADEYNGAVIFLCSDAASYMTGSNVVIDGGFTSW